MPSRASSWAIVCLATSAFTFACGSSADDAAGDPSGPDAPAVGGGTGGTGTAPGASGNVAPGASGGTTTPHVDAGSGGTSSSGGHGGGAGTSDAGGGGGSVIAPPHVVLPCSAGDGPIDTWEDITFDAIKKGGPQAVLVDPSNGARLYVGGSSAGVFKSENCGGTWSKVNTGKNGAALDSGSSWNMAIDPTSPQTIYTINGYGSPPHIFKSTNGGVDWDDLFPEGSDVVKTVDQNGFTQEMSMDPTDPRHLAVSFHANCSGAVAPSCLGETKDGGAHWRLLKSATNGWVEGASPIILGGDSWLLSTASGVYRTPDAGANWTKIADWGSHQAYHAKDGTWYLGSVDVLMSKDGVSWSHIAKSWRNVGMAGDGIRIFGSDQWPGADGQPYHAALESDPTKWTMMTSPKMGDGGDHLVYDGDHHLLYSTNHAGGLWRMRTH